MGYDTARLEAELAAYSPAELSELADTVSILLAAVDDGSTHYHNMRWRIESALAAAIAVRMEAEREAGQTGTVVPFPRKPDSA
jgi:hypothetical protein